MGKHLCDAMVICCIDFRFQNYIRQFTDEQLAGKTFDLVGYAGSTKELGTILNQVEISCRLHEIKELHLIHHEECGAYGRESTFEKHKEDLLRAKKTVLEKHPDLTIYTHYLHLDGVFEKVT